jgi:Fur family peroxide stress response transcriptional regulator
MVATRYDHLLTRLRQDGFRLTPQRMAVLRVLSADTGHPTVEQVYDRVRTDYPTTSLATIYKTIDMLKGIGEVLELSVGESHRYDGRDPRPHPHLICEVCGTISDLTLDGPLGDAALLAAAAQAIGGAAGYQDVRPQVEFRGRCASCQVSAVADGLAPPPAL